MGEIIYYIKKLVKYTLTRDHICYTQIKGYVGKTDFIEIDEQGVMLIRKFYGWDGCSGCTWDDDTNQTPGLHHDAKYQLMRIGILPQSCRGIADSELREECRARGMGRFRAWYYFEGVDHFAKYAAKYGTEPKEQSAP